MSELTRFLETDDKNVTQNRQLYVGGSDVPIILGISKYKTPFELAKEKIGLVPKEFTSNEYTVFGHALEPQIREYVNAINETNFQPDTVINKDLKIRCNCDGADYNESLLLEIKTHGKNPTMKVYEAQMQLYMYVFDLSAGWLALYERPENFDAEFDSERLKIEVIHRDDKYIEDILNQIKLFWKRCEALKANPEMKEIDFYSISLKEESNEIAVLANQVERFELQLQQFKEIEKQYKEMKDKLYAAMEVNNIKKFETEHIVITRILPSTRESLDSKKIKADHPELFEKYKKVSTVSGSVRIKLKEAN